jgi:hypothetical protein
MTPEVQAVINKFLADYVESEKMAITMSNEP